ncbi:MAG TPA: GTPase ObgE [Syntrophales bacterium]|nr:GTPase ObgE [Syntrophales bacterium]
MKFIDEAKIYVKGGDGGRGCVSFRREKYVPRGGPNGGDGGKGGDIVLVASGSHQTLLDLKYRQHHIAKHGGHGEGSDRTGRNSGDIRIPVPVGTVVKDAETGEVLADLVRDGETFIVARGGIGGRGNARFATPTNRAPRYAQPGMPGEERWILLELKLLADVGIIGLPNAGKSTFISRVSAARPKIADYPFTTLTPNLGVVKVGERAPFVVADIPGLIPGAHRGLGMGLKFLRHVERTSVLLHVIDLSGDAAPAGETMTLINAELRHFSPALGSRPQVVAIGKIDLTDTRERLAAAVDALRQRGIRAFPFSAVTGEGLPALLHALADALDAAREKNHEEETP